MSGSGGDSLKTIAGEIQRLIDAEESGVLVVVIGSTGSAPGKVGAKMLVLVDGQIHGTIGGGVIEARVMADALNALEDGRGPRSARYDLDQLGMSCGGQMTVYIEPLPAPRRVVIFGAGHVGAAVAQQVKTLGCVVTVVDEREEWANRERLPEVDEIVNRSFSEYLAETPPGSKDHVIIVTRGHEQDQLVLEETVERSPAYLGMIGSRKKAKRAKDLLGDKGVDVGLIKAIRSPMGLDIGAVTPEEIAVSLAAELIVLWRRGKLPEGRTAKPPKPPARKSKPPIRVAEPEAPADEDSDPGSA